MRPALLFLLGLAGCQPERTAPPNVLLISIDTLRADRLGCYGYARDTSPHLDRFARERAVRFDLAVAESSWTLPSHVTMLSGLHPLSHGVVLPNRAPSDRVEFLAETLSRAGYYGFASTDGGWLSKGWGFARGFRSFESADVDFGDRVEDAIDFIRHRSGKGPWFGFLHTYDVHCPYDPPEPWFSMFPSPDAVALEVAGRCGNPHYNELELDEAQTRYLSDRYDGGIRWVDEALGELFRHFDETDAWRNTIVIVTSDHGEEFGEHGRIGHEETLHREALFIPLFIAVPDLPPRVVEDPVGLMDLVPTILAAVGIEAEVKLDGFDLLPRMRGERSSTRELRVSHLAWKRTLYSRVTGDEHVILVPEDEAVLRYALGDREERRNLCAAKPCDELAAELTRDLAERGAGMRKTWVVEELEGR